MSNLMYINLKNNYWTSTSKKILEWDVRSYYGYLPSLFIYDDITLEFLNGNPMRAEIWTLKLENGKRIFMTSMGMAYLYLPGFLIADTLAEPLGYERTGFTAPYKIGVISMAFVFMFIGLLYLRKILKLYTNEYVISLVLIFVAIGTNLLYYSTYEAGMSHTYNFALIIVFLYHTINFYKTYRAKYIIYLGLLSGLICLIRPTNILILLLFVLWDIDSFKSLKDRFLFFLKKFRLVLLMFIMFLIPWIPQMLFWKMQTGQFLFYSYGEQDAKFFFENPQIYRFLFSYWKGWFVYTPIMLFAVIGLVYMLIREKKQAIGIFLYIGIIIYVLSSWWSWWFGGAFGQRSMIDFYGILAIPLAFFLNDLWKKWFLITPVLLILSVLTWYNVFQKNQYLTGALHYLINTKEMYWESFLKKKPTQRFKKITRRIDYQKAKEGIYELKPLEKPNEKADKDK